MWFHIVIATAILLMNEVESAPQPTADTQCGPMDVVFLLDSSQEMSLEDFEKQLEFANGIVDRLDIGPGPTQTRVGVISIGYTYLLQFYLRTHTSKDDVKTAISQINHRFSYKTNTGSSIRFMTRYMFRPFFGGRPGATRVAIVITDGRSKDVKSSRFEALLARKKGIKMFVIGVDVQNEYELISIGSKPKDNYVFKVANYEDLHSVIPNLPRTSCEVSSLTTRRPAPTKRFTFAPLNFDAFKFVPTKARAPISVPSSVTSARTTRAKIPATSVSTTGPPTTKILTSSNPSSSESTQKTTGPQSQGMTTNPPSTQAPTTRGPISSPATTNIPSTPAPTTRSPISSTTTTNIPSTQAPTTHGPISSPTTTNIPSTPAPTTRSPISSTTTTDIPSTPAPTTRSPISSTTTTYIPSTHAPTTRSPISSTTTTYIPSTPAPTTRGPNSSPTTTNIPSTPARTTHGPISSTTTTDIPSTPVPSTHGPSSSSFVTNPTSTPTPTTHGPHSPTQTPTTNYRSSTPPSSSPRAIISSYEVSNQPPELVSPDGLSDISLSNEPVEINNAPTKQVSETKGAYYKYFKKLYKEKRPLQRMSTGNNIPNVLSSNNGKWAPAPGNQKNERQYDAMMKKDKQIWSMMMGPPKPIKRPFRFNKLSRDIAIADEPKQYCGGKNADVFFALDSSNSIWPEDFRKQIEFVTDLVDTFDFRNNKTRVGIIIYSTDIYTKVSLQSGWTKEQIKRQLNNTEYVSGLTNTSDAIRFIRSYGFTEANAREDAIKIAIILTDGISRDPLATKRESILSREDGIKLFAIGIGTDVDETELKRIANDPDDKYVFHVSSFGALASIRSMVAVSACGVVPDQPSNLFSCGADSLADVIFVYDAPGLGARKARLLTSFVHDVTRSLQTSSGKLRIGRRSDSCPSNSNIDLTTDINLQAFSNIMFPGIETLLGQLRMAFPNRLDAKNLAIVFVDESTQNIELATRVLKGDLNFHVMVIAIGDMSLARVASDLASLPYNDYLMNIPSYMSLGEYRYEFLKKLCYLITNEPIYLRDTRVRQTRDL
ncbi:uncharacterized protein LOC117335108 [Pecten maximus]|uniref:uncharacterized protein LOC117335108 n=1 Tax=Pecten maximus TaxID=6579 RepID=UPI001458A7EB|nr:uncharacterized protein LOC117335108 [Pecten maximus]